jgi:hypothetical protein
MASPRVVSLLDRAENLLRAPFLTRFAISHAIAYSFFDATPKPPIDAQTKAGGAGNRATGRYAGRRPQP